MKREDVQNSFDTMVDNLSNMIDQLTHIRREGNPSEKIELKIMKVTLNVQTLRKQIAEISWKY